MLGGNRDIGHSTRAAKKEMYDDRDRDESLVRQVYEVEGMSREARDRERNTRDEAI